MPAHSIEEEIVVGEYKQDAVENELFRKSAGDMVSIFINIIVNSLDAKVVWNVCVKAYNVYRI